MDKVDYAGVLIVDAESGTVLGAFPDSEHAWGSIHHYTRLGSGAVTKEDLERNGYKFIAIEGTVGGEHASAVV